MMLMVNTWEGFTDGTLQQDEIEPALLHHIVYKLIFNICDNRCFLCKNNDKISAIMYILTFALTLWNV